MQMIRKSIRPHAINVIQPVAIFDNRLLLQHPMPTAESVSMELEFR
jgi:hypothetical protein